MVGQALEFSESDCDEKSRVVVQLLLFVMG